MAYIRKATLGKRVFAARGACIVGKVSLSDDVSVWYNAVLRGDEDCVTVGKGTNIQDNVVIHADHGYPCTIGEGCTIGHSAIVHGCTIGNHTVVGMGSLVMNGARLGEDCIIGAGSLVTQGTEIPSGMLAFGSPARVIRPLTKEEKVHNRLNADSYIELKKEHESLANGQGFDL